MPTAVTKWKSQQAQQSGLALHFQARERLRALPGLSLKEKMIASRELGRTWRGLGNLLVLSGKKSEARGLYWKSFLAYPTLRAPIKYGATFLPQDGSEIFVRKRTGAVTGEEKPKNVR